MSIQSNIFTFTLLFTLSQAVNIDYNGRRWMQSQYRPDETAALSTMNYASYASPQNGNYRPQPQNNYNVGDGMGNGQYHQQTGDGTGRVSGSYGYQSSNGLYRMVDYTADENGYRPTIRSNEPGVNYPEPAGVRYILEQPYMY